MSCEVLGRGSSFAWGCGSQLDGLAHSTSDAEYVCRDRVVHTSIYVVGGKRGCRCNRSAYQDCFRLPRVQDGAGVPE